MNNDAEAQEFVSGTRGREFESHRPDQFSPFAVQPPLMLPDNLVYDLPSLLDPLDLAAMFPVQQPLEVELGCGDGSFLLEYAGRHPRRNFLGIERLLGRIRKLDRKGRRLGLTNLRGIRIECAYFLEYLLPVHTVRVLHLYFPDPWPKKKHRKHRLVNDRFPELARRVLVPGGTVHLRTDDADYFEQMCAVFAGETSFTMVETPPALSEVLTDFERDFLAAGKVTLRASYRKVAAGAGDTLGTAVKPPNFARLRG